MPDKSKRKIKPKIRRSPLLYTGVGIFIGFLATAAFLLMGSTRSDMPRSEITFVQATVTPIAPPFPTTPPLPQPQATVIASRVQQAVISPQGNVLAVVDDDNGVTHVYLQWMNVRGNLSGHSRLTVMERTGYGRIEQIAFSPDGKRLLIADSNRSVHIYNIETAQMEPETLVGYHRMAFSPDGSRLVMLSVDGQIMRMDTEFFGILSAEPAQADVNLVQEMVVNERGDIAYAAGTDIFIHYARNEGHNRFSEYDGGYIHDLAFDHNGGHWLAIAANGFIEALHITNGERVRYPVVGERVHSVHFSADGRWLAIGGGSSGIGAAQLMVMRWNSGDDVLPPSTTTPMSVLNGHAHIISDVRFTPDGYLLTAAWDGSVRLWDVESGAEISRMQL